MTDIRQIRIDRVTGVVSGNDGVVGIVTAADRMAGGVPADDGVTGWLSASDDHRRGERCLRLDRDWRGMPASAMVHALLVLDDVSLHFVAWLPGPAWQYADAVAGRFRPGLWQRDVVEMFLCDREGDGYREYHLSPGGEWWMGCFSSPRVATAGDASRGDQPMPPAQEMAQGVGIGGRPHQSADEAAPGVSVAVESDGDGWRGGLSLPRCLLPPGFSEACDAASCADRATGLSANVAAIVGRDTRHFLSVTPLPGVRPDFHQPRTFPPVFVCRPRPRTR